MVKVTFWRLVLILIELEDLIWPSSFLIAKLVYKQLLNYYIWHELFIWLIEHF